MENIDGQKTRQLLGEFKAAKIEDVSVNVGLESMGQSDVLKISYKHKFNEDLTELMAEGEIKILDLIPLSKASVAYDGLHRAQIGVRFGPAHTFDAKLQMNDQLMRFKLENKLVYDFTALFEVTQRVVNIVLAVPDAERLNIRLKAELMENYKVCFINCFFIIV